MSTSLCFRETSKLNSLAAATIFSRQVLLNSTVFDWTQQFYTPLSQLIFPKCFAN